MAEKEYAVNINAVMWEPLKATEALARHAL